MKWFLFFGVFVTFPILPSCQQLVEIRRNDGSYSIGRNSNSLGSTSDSVVALLTKASGWTGSTGFKGTRNNDNQISSSEQITSEVQTTNQLPQVLKLIESLVRLKGQFAGRAWGLANDNSHTIAALRDTLVNKISSIHNLSLNALVIFRKVLEFAGAILGNVSLSRGPARPLLNKRLNIGR